MKKIILFAAAALLTLTASAQGKFAHVNFSELVQLMPEADAARSQINAASKEAQDTYQAMIEEYQTKAQQYDQKKATWTDAIRQSKEKELNEIGQRIQEFQQTIQNELAQQQSQLMAPIQELTPDARKALNIPDGRTLESLQQELQAQAQAQGE